MAARAYWQGHIRLALVSIPVEIYTAMRSGAAISFCQIHEETGKPIRYQKVATGIGPASSEESVKGYEISKGDYVLLEEAEIEAVKNESRLTLDLVQFAEADDIDVLYFEKPYYVVPANDLAEQAYIVLRDALRRTRKTGTGQLSDRGREQLVCIRPCGRGMVMEVLRYADDVQKAHGFFRDIKDAPPNKELLELAETLIDKKTANFDPASFHDHYVDALHRLIEKKRKSKGKRVLEDVEEEAARRGSNVIDLMAALKRSVAVGKEATSTRPAKPVSRARPATLSKKRA